MHKDRTKRTSRIVYIVDGSRTPFLKMRGEPGPFSAADLAVNAGKNLVDKYCSPDHFDEVIIGCAGPSEEEANIARIIALRLGCGLKVPAWTVQRNCASGLQSIDAAAQSIASGASNLVLAGGTEAMSRAPLLYNQAMTRWLGKMQQGKTFGKKLKTLAQFRPAFLVPIIALLKGLTDPVVNLNMGQTAEELAYRFHISRNEMDQFSVQSHQRALAAQASGEFDEISPLYSNNGEVFEQDDGVRQDSSIEKLAKLKPVFEKFGDITAGNSSQITDGAALVILASEEAVQRFKLPVLAKIADIQWAALDPAIMGLGPVHAMTPLLQRNGLSLKEIDYFEINEAFAAQVLACKKAWSDADYCQRILGLDAAIGEMDMERLNPYGGAIAMGHPVGASGTRLVLQSAKLIARHKLNRTIVSLCIGGGQGGAILLESVTAV